ncbi:MAG: transmembrane sensory transduction histidine kinase for metal resistance [Thermomicrobium sp.]
MEFGLAEMQVVALIGLLAIASLAAWSSATLWHRQRVLERAVAELATRLEGGDGQESERTGDEHLQDASTAVAELVTLLKAADRSALEEVLRPPLDLPRARAIDADGGSEGPRRRFGLTGDRNWSGWEA